MRDESVWAVWNRALWRQDEDLYREGDRALASLLWAHAMIMGDGVQGGVEGLTDPEVDNASEGYRFFGLGKIADLIQRVKPYRGRYEEEFESLYEEFGAEYSRSIADDQALFDIVERRLRDHPDEFAST